MFLTHFNIYDGHTPVFAMVSEVFLFSRNSLFLDKKYLQEPSSL